MILLALITAIASALLDNVTTVLLIAPVTLLVCDRLDINPTPFLISEVFAANIGGTAHSQALWWSLTLAADLGGNMTAIGASANVVMLGIAARAGTPITFWQFTKKGVIITAVTIAVAAPYLWLRYFVLA